MEGRPLNMDLFDKLTFPRLNLKDNTLDDNDLVRRCPLDNDHACNTPQQDLGALDALPLELLQVLLAQLDLRTLTDFRRVNQRALQVVDSIPGYKAITTHAPNALRGILSIGTGRWITCETLHDKLCTAECETCGDFGCYIYALTCKRVCFLCLSEHEAYLPVPLGLARRKFGINRQVLDTLPHFRSLPGTYSPNEKNVAIGSLYGISTPLIKQVACFTAQLAQWKSMYRTWHRKSYKIGARE